MTDYNLYNLMDLWGTYHS